VKKNELILLKTQGKSVSSPFLSHEEQGKAEANRTDVSRLLNFLSPWDSLVLEEEVSCSRAERGAGAALAHAAGRGLPGARGRFTQSSLT